MPISKSGSINPAQEAAPPITLDPVACSCLEVALAAPLPEPLSYAPPREGPMPVPGCRVLVPLAGRLVTGYVLKQSCDKPDFDLKPISALLDEGPVFPENMIPFFRWIARYYHHPIGEVIRAALPGGLTTASGRRLSLSPEGLEYFGGRQDLLDTVPWLARLLAKGRLDASATARLWRSKERKQIERWAKEGLILVEERLCADRIREKTEVCILPGPLVDPAGLPQELKPSERKTLEAFLALSAERDCAVSRRDLTRACPGASRVLARLAERGLIQLIEQRVFRTPCGDPPPFFPKPTQLSQHQQEVLTQLEPAIAARKHRAFLLHGVTGSGKTEVYLRAAECTLSQGRAVLVLVPEIALATQLEAHFFSRFGERVALLHSGLKPGERFDQWRRVLGGEAPVVIGARSAVFAPLADPGLIIVDEEHDPAYKQEDGLLYQGRDLAVLRGNQVGAVVLLGSATPAVASYQHAISGKYQLLNLPERIANRPLPEVEIVDLKMVPTASGRPPLFSPQLTRAVRETLRRGEQSILFLNRRGFAGSLICGDCGQTVQCNNCQVSLTLHKGKNQLICHYCGHSVRGNTVCARCRSENLLPVGFGTERIEEEMERLFPKARIARLDRDTTGKRSELLRVLRAVREREVDILVGTQMIAKGHHFPHVTLVGVVWVDTGLGIPDFKAGERTFQLLAQVTGRAGRGDRPGRVIIQTHQPEHYSVVSARLHDYKSLFGRELALRGRMAYPPFSRLINLLLEGENEGMVRQRAMDLAAAGKPLLRGRSLPEILGPAPSPLARLRGKYRWQILLKGDRIDQLHELCRRLEQEHTRLGTGVKLTVDVDPESML